MLQLQLYFEYGEEAGTTVCGVALFRSSKQDLLCAHLNKQKAGEGKIIAITNSGKFLRLPFCVVIIGSITTLLNSFTSSNDEMLGSYRATTESLSFRKVCVLGVFFFEYTAWYSLFTLSE